MATKRAAVKERECFIKTPERLLSHPSGAGITLLVGHTKTTLRGFSEKLGFSNLQNKSKAL
jgi:hypothetical protein